MTLWKRMGWIGALLLMVMLAGCSGGNDGAKFGAVVDPAASYKGATIEAIPTQTNAEALAMGGFGFAGVAEAFRTVAKANGDMKSKPTLDRPVLELVQVLKQSVRQMDLPQKAKLLHTPLQSTVAKTSSRGSNYQVFGDGGGIATYSLDVNDATGSFFGTVVYTQYSSNGVVVNGTTEILGSFDTGQQQISRITFSFESLTFQSGDTTVSLTGSLSSGYSYASRSEAVSMNVVLLDQASAKTFWFKNYEVTTAYDANTNSLTETITGRYYDHDNGYVDLSTQNPLVINYGYEWPTQGALIFNGSSGKWVRLNFGADSVVIEVDVDGNGGTDWQVERPMDIRPTIDVPPTADAGPDQAVMQWSTVQLNGSSSNDPNGDPLTYRWETISGPDNYYPFPTLTNATTATPSFTAERAGTYVYGLSVHDGYSYSMQDMVSITVSPITTSHPTLLAKQWQFGTYYNGIGQAGFFATDLDGDGAVEIIASASDQYWGKNVLWYVVRRNSSGGYDQVWQSPNYGIAIARMLLTDMTGDGKNDVVVALVDGTICIYNNQLQEVRTLTVVPQLTDIAIADLDMDGTKEIVASDGMGVFVYNAVSGALKWSVSTRGGKSIAVGNTDADPSMEIVTTIYGGKGYVLSGLSGEMEWEYINSFGASVRLGDLDGDGMQEIVSAAPWGKITVFDADLRSPTWEVPTDHEVPSIIVADADGDGIPEIVYGDGQWGGTHAIDVRNRTEKWSVNNPGYIVQGIVLGDVDLDGKTELLWGTSGSTLHIADPSTGSIKWKNTSENGLHAVALGDLDNDGEDEVVMASSSSDNANNDGILHIFNARTHALKFQLDLGTRDYDADCRVVRIGDVDGDGRLELVVSTADYFQGLIRIYDGATFTLKCQSPIYDGRVFTALALADVDSDGKIEIVAAQRAGWQDGAYLMVLDGATMQEKWRSVNLAVNYKYFKDIKVADLDKDGQPDIIASLTDNRLIVYDGVTHILKLMTESLARAIEVVDVDGDGYSEVLVGRNDGKIDVYDGVTFAIKRTASTFGKSPIDALLVTDIDDDGLQEWLVASNSFPDNGVLSILDSNGLKWRSSNLGFNLGVGNSIAVKKINGDSRKSIYIGSGSNLYHFK